MSTWPTLAPKSADVSVCGDDAIGTGACVDDSADDAAAPKAIPRAPAAHPNAAKKSGEKANAASPSADGPRARAKITDAPAAVSEPEFARREGFEEVSNALDARAVSSSSSSSSSTRRASLPSRIHAEAERRWRSSARARKSALSGSLRKNSGAGRAMAPAFARPSPPATARLASTRSATVTNRSNETPAGSARVSAATRRPTSSWSTSSSNARRSARARTTHPEGMRSASARA